MNNSVEYGGNIGGVIYERTPSRDGTKGRALLSTRLIFIDAPKFSPRDDFIQKGLLHAVS